MQRAADPARARQVEDKMTNHTFTKNVTSLSTEQCNLICSELIQYAG